MNLQFLKNSDPRYLPSLSETEAKVEELMWLNITDREKILAQLKVAFAGTGDRTDALVWRAFWMVYTKFTWSFFRAQDRDFFEKTVVGRQIPMAALLGYDLLDEIFNYLDVRTLDQDEMASLYGNIRSAYFNSSALIGKMDGQNFLISDLVKKERYLNSVKDNTLEEAKFRDNLQRAFFPKEDNFLNKYFLNDDREAVVTGVLNLTDFFLGVEPDKVWYAVDAYINPDKYEAMADVLEKGVKVVTPVSNNLELPEKEYIEPIAQTVGQTAPTYKEIASRIENEHVRDTEGNFVDLDSVFEELAELSEKYNDPKISELYYFDENSGMFRWSV